MFYTLILLLAAHATSADHLRGGRKLLGAPQTYNEGVCAAGEKRTVACKITVDSKGWYDRGATFARFYVDGVLQDFKGGTSYDAPDIFEGMGTYGFNFARLKVTEGKCAIERIGRGFYSYGGSKCYDRARVRQKFHPGDIMLVGVSKMSFY